MSAFGARVASSTRLATKINFMQAPLRNITEMMAPNLTKAAVAPTVQASSGMNDPSTTTFKFSVQSTFRNLFHQPLLPMGLEWGLAGTSHMAYAVMNYPNNSSKDVLDLDSDEHKEAIRRGIVTAHNQWSFAKDLPFKQVHDIESISMAKTGKHVFVQWKGENNDFPTSDSNENDITVCKFQDISKLLQSDPSSLGRSPPTPVWLNGVYLTDLKPSTLDYVLSEIERVPSLRLMWKKTILKGSSGNEKDAGQNDEKKDATLPSSILRIERYFTGGLRNRQDIFEHIMDNLYAMEDVTIMDENTIIGTATLPDWIMGGDLTSRLWVRVFPGTGVISFRRPLYNDDLQTSDRKFDMKREKDDDNRYKMVISEIERLRYTSELEYPFVELDGKMPQAGNEDGEASLPRPYTAREKQHHRNRRRYYGL